MGIESVLDAAHEVQVERIFHAPQFCSLHATDTVLSRDLTAQFDDEVVNGRRYLIPLREEAVLRHVRRL